jgi:CHAT domain-containing protein/tetratricopeptide (TPR) repeat protein
MQADIHRGLLECRLTVANRTGRAVPAPGVLSHPIGQRRRRIAHPGVSLVVAVAALCARHPGTTGLAAAPRAQDASPLERGAAIEGDLSTGQSHTYRLSLATGDFIRITIEQKGLDVAVTLLRPDGRDLVVVDASNNDFRPETIVAIADISGTYTIDVRPSPLAGPHGHYAIRVDEQRASAPPDDIRIEAERAFARGRQWTMAQPAAYREALGEFSRALDRYRRVGDRQGELKADLEVGITQSVLFVPEALVSARRVEQIARELHDQPARASALRLLGFEDARAGDLAAGLRAFEEATAMSRALGDQRAEVASLNGEGMIYGRTGEGEKAVVRFEQALLRTRATNREAESGLLNNLGITYKNLGWYDKSVDVYEQSLALARAKDDRAMQATILNNMGNVQRLLGNHRPALALHTEALALSRQTAGTENEARSLNTIGLTHYSLGDFSTALEYHRDSLAIRRQLADLPGQAASLDGAGRALQRLGESEQALAALREALTIRRNIRDQYGETGTLRHLAAVERDRGDLAEALRHVEAAVDLDETLRGRITSPELRATYVAAEQNKYELFIDVLQQLHAVNPTGGYAAIALHVSERARARVLLESLLDARVDLRQGIDPALLERERSLQKQLGDLSAQLSRSLARTSGGEQSSGTAQKIERLTADYQQLQAQIRQQSPRYAAVTQPQPLDASAIQQSVVDDDTVLLEFALGEERSWLWAVTPRTLTTVELPPRREIDAAARSLYELFTARQRRGSAYARQVPEADTRLGEQAAAMSAMLLGGIARQLNDEWRSKRLAIVAAGALEYLPFAALPSPVHDRAGPAVHAVSVRRGPSSLPLVFRHEIVMIPSASVLAVLRRETAGRRPAPRTLAILADPVFEATDPRVTSPRPRPASAVKDDTASSVGDLMDSLYAADGFSRLPFSREEGNTIAALVGAPAAFRAMDFKASRATVLSGALGGHRIVHFATHGIVDSERPSLSSLILSLVDEHGGRQNGYLRLHDIYNLRLDADLVVLSGCQTALGKEIKGEGLVGLTRAFIYAGAPRVVASLWEVSDFATAELMKAFYRGMLQQHLPPAAALRAAQLQLSQDPRWASPYFWAGFVLQGQWQ